ncbi:MAG TPA: CDGSH iron-sulfur domain-containing protein, partial [Anaerolineae bacterium]
PYVVTGGVPLVQRYPAMSVHGEPLAWDPVGAEGKAQPPAEEAYELCRCGHSHNKPYCDGTHEQVGFVGTLTADRTPGDARRQKFEADGLVMTDEPALCAGAGFCGTRFTKVWQMIDRTSDPEVRKRLREMVANCPSGRLQVTLSGENTPEEPEFTPSIALIPDGPLWVRGGIEIQAPDGFIYEVHNRVTLCRCGKSHNSPFCDESHVEAGFQAPLEE